MGQHAEANRRRAIRIAGTLLLGAAAGALAKGLNAPLPWMLGPLIVTAALCSAGAPLVASRRVRNAGQWAIGTALGLYFTPQVVALLLRNGVPILVGVAWALAAGVGFGWFLKRANPGNAALDRPTLFFATTIGSASEMTLLAERHGGRLDLVASAHSLRMLLVVVTIPFVLQFAGLHGIDPTPPGPSAVQGGGFAALTALTVAAALLLQRLDMINPWMLGPLAVAVGLTACGIELSALPAWVPATGQVLIGVALGTRFSPAFVHTAPRWLLTVGIGCYGLMGVCALFAWGLAALAGLHPVTVMLGASPGGIAEMSLTAKVLQLGVPLVTAFHVTRMVGVLLLAGPLYRWLASRAAA